MLNKFHEEDPKYFFRGIKGVPSTKAKYDLDEDDILELALIKNDFFYWVENYYYITFTDTQNMRTIIRNGQEISVPVKKTEPIDLYDFQREILVKFFQKQHMVTVASRQIGKALDVDTPIPTPDGWTTMGELKDGQEIFTTNGNTTKILKAHDVMYNRNCYEVEFSNGEIIVADEDHNWWTQSRTERKRNCKGSVKTTKEILQTLHVGQKIKESAHRIRQTDPVPYPEKDLPVDPYLLGVWLGDGHTNGNRISSHKDDYEEMMQYIHECHDGKVFAVQEKGRNTFNIHLHDFTKKLKEIGVFGDKHIPRKYIQSSVQQRLELIRGLMDTDGTIDRRSPKCEFCTIKKEIANAVSEILFSLGIQNSITTKIPKINGKEYNTAYRVQFTCREFDLFKLTRKRILNERHVKGKNERNKFLYIKDIRPVNSRPVRCITVDSEDSLFLCGNTFVPTHNTTILVALALYTACYNENHNILLFSHMESSAKQIISRIKDAYILIPNHMKPSVKSWGALEIEFDNGSTIKAGATSIKSGHGETIDLLLLDEFDYVPTEVQEGFILGIMPTVSTSYGKIFICSSANSTKGYFYKFYQQALSHDPEWSGHSAYWYDVPGRDKKFKTKALSEVGGDERLFRKAYECDFGATEEDGVGLMAKSGFVALNKKDKKQPISNYEFFGDCCQIYEIPDKDKIYTMGVDPAEGVGQNNSTIEILDITDLQDIKQVCEYAYNRIHPLEFVTVILKLAKTFGQPWISIERNNHGAMVIESLIRDHKYPKLVHWGMKNDKKGYYQRYGINSQGNSKKTAIVNMRYYLDTVCAITINSPQCIDELIHFKRKSNGTWGGVHHNDDRVDALNWALCPLHDEVINQCFEILEQDTNGKPLMIKDKLKLEWDQIEGGRFFRPIGAIKQNNNTTPIPQLGGIMSGNISQNGWKIQK